jgi:23S rRNA pseudouridine2605 synthase
LIARGVVTIDGRRAKAGDRVDPARGEVRVNGKRVHAATGPHITIALNKPLGMLTTMRDERGRPCVGDLIRSKLHSVTARAPRLVPVGRLDAQSSGLLLCTSDGELCRVLSHPSSEVPRRYRGTVNGDVSLAAQSALNATNLKKRADGTTQFEMVLHAGANREIRRRCAHLGLRVIALERIAFGLVRLGNLKSGEHRNLTERESQQLLIFRKSSASRPTKRGPVGLTE